MKRAKSIILVFLLCLIVLIITYLPRIVYPLPLHVDEWHHIDESIRLKKTWDIPTGLSGTETGFHLFLAILSFFVDILTFYKYLPAIWATASALVLFYIVKKKTKDDKKSFFIACMSIIFFASIKSNVNLTGLLFFTPLTFSIPFIFLYIYLFTEGITKNNKKYIAASLVIMTFIIFVHAISFLFSIPMLILFCMINIKKIKEHKQYKILSLFILIPIIGIIYYKIVTKVSFYEVLKDIINQLQFKYGWGVVELNNSLLEVYSIIGYILASLSIIVILTNKEKRQKYIIYALWPILISLSILIFKLTGTSYLSPFQRNLYYLVISLPFLTALGTNYLISFIESNIESLKLNDKNKKIIKKISLILITILIIFLTFYNYFDINKQTKLYMTIDMYDYQALKFLSSLPESKIIANLYVSTAAYSISGHTPIGALHFYNNQKDVERFFNSKDCYIKEFILNKNNVRYIMSNEKIECNWTLIYQENKYIYDYTKK